MSGAAYICTDDGLYLLRDGAAARLGLEGKSVSALVWHPDNPQLLHAGTWEDGVYRSTDGGSRWERVLAADVWTVCQRADRAELLYAGVEPAGVYRSSDFGATWVELPAIYDLPTYKQWWFPPPPHIAHVTSFVPAPHDVKTIFAGVEVGGIIVSRDGGRAWAELHEGLHDDIHWMAHGVEGGQFTLYSATAQGFYRSDDEGAHWHRSDAGMDRHYAYCLARVGGAAPRLVMCASRDSNATNSIVYRSEDGGAHWTVGMGGDMPSPSVRGRMKVAADPARDGVCYASLPAGVVLRSEDAGATWRQLALGLPYVNALTAA